MLGLGAMDVELRYCVFYWSCQECCGSIGRHFLIFLIKISAIYTQIYIYIERKGVSYWSYYLMVALIFFFLFNKMVALT